MNERACEGLRGGFSYTSQPQNRGPMQHLKPTRLVPWSQEPEGHTRSPCVRVSCPSCAWLHCDQEVSACEELRDASQHVGGQLREQARAPPQPSGAIHPNTQKEQKRKRRKTYKRKLRYPSVSKQVPRSKGQARRSRDDTRV